jgi:hypothetical protein
MKTADAYRSVSSGACTCGKTLHARHAGSCPLGTSDAVVRASDVDVSTVDFRFSHGREPRGFGSWAFYYGFGRGDTLQEPTFFNQATYASARRAAVKDAASRGFTFVEVGS